MKSKILLIGVCAAASLAAACHNNDGSAGATTPSTPPPTTPPMTSNTMSLDTAQVLALAQQTSETSSPFEVNAGAFVFTDTSETSSPISVTQ
jgi:hypothetical protein